MRSTVANWTSHTPSGAPIVVIVTRMSAPRLSTIPLRQKAIAALIAVRPLSSRAHGWISLMRS